MQKSLSLNMSLCSPNSKRTKVFVSKYTVGLCRGPHSVGSCQITGLVPLGRSLGSWCIKGTDESMARVDSLVPFRIENFVIDTINAKKGLANNQSE